MSSDYAERAAMYGFATKKQILEAMKDPNVVLLDVRSEDEIAQDRIDSVHLVVSRCTPISCPTLEGDALSLLPKKDAPIVIYCASGRRASRAQQVLTSQGYTRALNAGGMRDIQYLNGM